MTGGRIWYCVRVGDGGVPLVVVHGGAGFTHDYLEPLAALADERPVVFYDQLGAGRSDAPDVRAFLAGVDSGDDRPAMV